MGNLLKKFVIKVFNINISDMLYEINMSGFKSDGGSSIDLELKSEYSMSLDENGKLRIELNGIKILSGNEKSKEYINSADNNTIKDTMIGLLLAGVKYLVDHKNSDRFHIVKTQPQPQQKLVSLDDFANRFNKLFIKPEDLN